MESPPPIYGEVPQPPQKKNPWLVPAIIAGVVVVCLCPLPILAALLFPVFSQARLAALNTRELTNAKQSAMALVIYAADYDEMLAKADGWMDAVTPYVGVPPGSSSGSVFNTPLEPGMTYGFAFNSSLSQVSLTTVEAADKTVLVFSSTLDERNANGGPEIARPIAVQKPFVFGACDSSAKSVKEPARMTGFLWDAPPPTEP